LRHERLCIGSKVRSFTLPFCSSSFGAQRRPALSIDWLDAGAANAGRILEGEWWRTITALALHVELGHLMGNLAFGVVISLLVAALLGSGRIPPPSAAPKVIDSGAWRRRHGDRRGQG
jgi:membrane associated rhomboid family serine protease